LKKKLITLAAILLAGALFLEGGPAAASCDSLELSTAFGGASLLLAQYCESNENGYEDISGRVKTVELIGKNAENMVGGRNETDTRPLEIIEEQQMVVCVEGNLNIREAPSGASDRVMQIWRGSTVSVVGKQRVKGLDWYLLRINGVEGFALAEYIKTEDQASVYFEELRKQGKTYAHLPEKLTISEDLSNLDSTTASNLKEYVTNINECLSSYLSNEDSGQTLSMYTLLQYLLELYDRVRTIAMRNGLVATYSQASSDVIAINETRESLKEISDMTDEDFKKKIEEARRKAAEEKMHKLQRDVVKYAESFVGILPYVWGGASLTKGADCSGFVGQIFAHFGLLDQTKASRHEYDSYDLRRVGVAVDIKDIQPGDIVCYPGHVAIYYGNGICIHEPSVGRKCDYGDLYMLKIVCVRRLIELEY